MAVYFVSDFHLGEANVERDRLKLELFRRFRAQSAGDLEHLIILGDLYDFWFEYKHLIPKRNLGILLELKALAESGVKLSYVCGNHDFWLLDFMQSEIGCQVHRDTLELTGALGRVLVLHGDGVAPSDWKYRLLKGVLRNRVNIALFKLLPPALAYGLAHRVSGGSRYFGEEKPTPEFVAEYHDFARRQIAAGYHAVVCGHIHWPEIKEIEGGFYVNSGDWINFFSYVRFDGTRFELGNMKPRA